MHLEIRSSSKPNKKYYAIFTRNNKTTKVIHFGDNRYEDYTQHHKKMRRALYIKRHQKNENWNDPESAGSLSRHILWGDSTNIHKNIRDFRTKFGYS